MHLSHSSGSSGHVSGVDSVLAMGSQWGEQTWAGDCRLRPGTKNHEGASNGFALGPTSWRSFHLLVQLCWANFPITYTPEEHMLRLSKLWQTNILNKVGFKCRLGSYAQHLPNKCISGLRPVQDVTGLGCGILLPCSVWPQKHQKQPRRLCLWTRRF